MGSYWLDIDGFSSLSSVDVVIDAEFIVDIKFVVGIEDILKTSIFKVKENAPLQISMEVSVKNRHSDRKVSSGVNLAFGSVHFSSAGEPVFRQFVERIIVVVGASSAGESDLVPGIKFFDSTVLQVELEAGAGDRSGQNCY